MREGMVSDGMAFVINPLSQTREFIGLNADEKKCGGSVLTLEHIENLGGPVGVGTVIESQYDFVGAIAVAAHPVRFRHGLEILVGDQLGIGINREVTSAVSRLGLDAKDFALTLHVHILAGRH